MGERNVRRKLKVESEKTKDMKTKTKKGKRNTAAFYALLALQPGYLKAMQAECKEIEVMEFLKDKYGRCDSTSLSALSDRDYSELLADLRKRAEASMTRAQWVDQSERKRYINLIFSKLSEMGVEATRADRYEDVNYHIQRLPISKRRTIPQIPTNELPGLLNAVRGYVDAMVKRQKKEIAEAVLN